MVDWNYEIENPGVPGVHNLTGLDSDTRSYMVGIANAGFNLVLNHFAIGLEAGYNYRSRTNPTSYFDTFDSQSVVRVGDVFNARAIRVTPCKVRFDNNSQHAGTLDLLPGFVYSRFIAYLRLGVEHAQYKFERRVCVPTTTLVTNFDALIDDEEYIFSPPAKTEDGYRIGFGFGVAACQNLSFHLNFIHTFSEKISFTPDVSPIIANAPVIVAPAPGDIVITNLNQLASNIIIEPDRNEVNLSMRWTF